MRRLFWIALGATAGVLVVRKVQKTAEQFTPTGIAGSLSVAIGELSDAVREFAEDVRAGMTERETELREALGMNDDESATPGAAPEIPSSPTR